MEVGMKEVGSRAAWILLTYTKEMDVGGIRLQLEMKIQWVEGRFGGMMWAVA